MKKAILAAAILTVSSQVSAGVANDYARAAIDNLNLAQAYVGTHQRGPAMAAVTAARSQLAGATNITGNQQCAYARTQAGDVLRWLQGFEVDAPWFWKWQNAKGMLNNAIDEAQYCRAQVVNQ